MKKIAIAALLSAFAAAPALAENMYASVNFGKAHYGYTNITNDSQSAFGIQGGYILNENFSIEVEYNNLGGFDSAPDKVEGTSIGVNAVGNLPVSPEFSLFGKLGIANSSLKDSIPGSSVTYKNTGIKIGFGAQYNATPTVGIQVGLDSTKVGDSTSGTDRARVIYVGGMFKF